MRVALSLVFSLLSTLLVPRAGWAQLAAAKDGPIVYGHHHLNVTNIDEHKKFWVGTLGGTQAKARADIVQFPNVFVFLRQQAPAGGTKGSVVNHIGFQVPNIRATVDRLRAAGYPIITKDETTNPEKDGIAVTPQNTYIAFVMGPDSTKVEIVENKAAAQPISLHHVHFFNPEFVAMRDWYAKTFAATPGKRGAFETAELPGVNLYFAMSPTPVVPTQGRALDHVGFEVKNLENFCKQLEAHGIKLDRPYTKVPALGIAIAFFTDPWGTYVELTEGLSGVQ
jgi:catechol 2,3-dioxygenase-like lactoylglutathione lyase family enzyme